MATVIRRRARQDIFELWDRRASTYSEASADALLQAITKALRHLGEYPHSGRPRDDLRPRLRSHPIRRYVIFYYPQPDGIIVSRVLYGGRDIESIFENEPDADEDE